MTRKELSRLNDLRKYIKIQVEYLTQLESAAKNCTSRITGMPRSKTNSDKVGTNAAKIADLKTLIKKNLNECYSEEIRLIKYINKADDPIIKSIMICRYIKGFNWKKTALIIGGNNTVAGLKKKINRYLKYHS